MRDDLKVAIQEYIKKVEQVCQIITECNKVEGRDGLLEFRVNNPSGSFKYQGMNYYQFHGRGCKFWNDTIEIDWDFSYNEQSWCGINPWLLAEYIKKYTSLTDYYSGSEIKKALDLAVSKKEMYIKYELYYLNGK